MLAFQECVNNSITKKKTNIQIANNCRHSYRDRFVSLEVIPEKSCKATSGQKSGSVKYTPCQQSKQDKSLKTTVY